MLHKISHSILAIVTAFSIGAAPKIGASQDTAKSTPFVIPYHLDKPEKVYKLPHKLEEISGLTVSPDGLLIAIQDEQAILFSIDPSTGVVKDEFRFGKKGDFEGVEFMNGLYYVLRSDGMLFPVDIDDDDSEPVKFKARVPNGCDAEGLSADVYTNRLLILCKEKAGKGLNHSKTVYVFDLPTGKLRKEPLIVLSRDTFSSALQVKKSTFSSFKPAALAVHPQTGHFYIISSRDQRLLVLNRAGRLLGHHQFEDKDMRQPEGLAFGHDGYLYVASEGAGKRGTILRFRPDI